MSEPAPFVAAILEDADDIGRWLTYADWLITRGDPRGELISFELTFEATGTPFVVPVKDDTPNADLAREIDRRRLQQERWLSPRLVDVLDMWELTLRRSFIHTAFSLALHDHAAEPIEALFADPHVGLLAKLHVHCSDPVWRAAVFAAPRPRLRDLSVCDLGELAGDLDTHVPRLERLILHGNDPALVAFAHDRLHTLVADQLSCPATYEGRVHTPQLRRLDWQVGIDDRLLFDSRSILHVPPPKLVDLHLALVLPDDVEFDCDASFTRIAELPIRTTLESLEVEWGSITGIERLCAANKQFPKLRRIIIGEGRWLEVFDVSAAIRAAVAQLPSQLRGTPEGMVEAIRVGTARRETPEAGIARELLTHAFPNATIQVGRDVDFETFPSREVLERHEIAV